MISLLILSALISGTVGGTDKMGIGVILGEPTGLNAKLWFTETTAIDRTIAWSLGEYNTYSKGKKGHLWLNIDYLYHRFDLFEKITTGELGIYYGFGGRTILEEDPRIGVRFVLGVEYFFDDAPFDAFFELAPIIDFIPATDAWLSGGIGIRFWF